MKQLFSSLSFSVFLLVSGSALSAQTIPSPTSEAISNFTTSLGLPPVQKTYLHLNGLTIHFDKRPEPGKTVNDYLIGLGGSIEFETSGTFIYGVTFDVFNDSNKEIAAVIGPSAEWPLHERFRIGASLFLFYKESFQRDNGFPLLVTPLPFADIRLFERAHLRTYYIPPVRKPTDHQLTFQLRIPF